MVTITSLIFELQCEPPTTRSLIVQIGADGNGRWTVPAHPDHTIVDVKAGHVLVHRRQPHKVISVRPYRTSLCREGYGVVESGRDWLAGG